MLRSFLKTIEPFIDIFLSILVGPAAGLLWLYRRYGSAKLPRTTSILRRIGVFPIINHYYEPLFDPANLSDPLDKPRNLPGIDFCQEGQLAFLERLAYADEFTKFVSESSATTGDLSFKIDNGSFENGDADFLFQILRHKKPKKVIEIGSGWSTKVAQHALALNSAETGKVVEHICIEPYEQPWLEQLGGITVLRQKVEDCNIDWITALSSGDMLFIDSSHMIRPQGDVIYEYLDIIPQLASGVLVHVHDIFTPRDYLTRWVHDDVKFWNEQYLLEMLLTNTARYKVVAGLNMLKHAHFDALKAVCPSLAQFSEPGSFYFCIK